MSEKMATILFKGMVSLMIGSVFASFSSIFICAFCLFFLTTSLTYVIIYGVSTLVFGIVVYRVMDKI